MTENNERRTLENVERQIAEIISDVSGQSIKLGVDGLQDLHLDSLSKLEILTLLEERFSFSLTEESANQFTSISSIARIVVRTMDGQATDW